MSVLDTWKDGTTYWLFDSNVPRVQSAWCKDIDGIFIFVRWGCRASPGNWILDVVPWFDTYDLGRCGDLTPEQAVYKALRLVSTKVIKMERAFQLEMRQWWTP